MIELTETQLETMRRSFISRLEEIAYQNSSVNEMERLSRVIAEIPPNLTMIDFTITNPTKAQLIIAHLLKSLNTNINIRMEIREPIPVIEQIRHAADILRERGLGEEGIFRLSENKLDNDKITAMVLRGDPVDFTQYHSHTLANMIKMVASKHYKSILTIPLMTSLLHTGTLKPLFYHLPKGHQEFLSIVCDLTRMVVSKEHQNRMNINAMARMWAPNFFRDDDPMVEVEWLNDTTKITQEILLNFSISSNQ